jgi:hypothetical protein
MALRQADQWSLALLNVDRNKMHIRAHHPEIPKKDMERLISLIAATAEIMGWDLEFTDAVIELARDRKERRR